MEVNHQPPPAAASEVSSHGCSPIHHDEQEVIIQQPNSSRSYECNFCKKGFSNAQALGGHMNIHRKDKAKLKQASSRSSTSTSTSTSSCYYYNKPLEMIMSSAGGTKWPCIFSSSSSSSDGTSTHNNVSELKQLPLFVDKASTTTTTTTTNSSRSRSRRTDFSSSWHQDLNFQSSSSHGSFGGAAELDLELRLGHVPPKSTSVSMDTRKFF